jgi:phosphate-selective porin OprO/OprP
VIGGVNAYEGSLPTHSWDPSRGYFGALEIAARYGRLDLDPRAFPAFADPTKSPHAAMTVGLTLSWVLGKLYRTVIAWERTQFEGGAGMLLAAANRPTEYVLVTRMTLNL